MDLDDRISNLTAATVHGNVIEQDLLLGEVIDIAPVVTGSPGASHPLLVVMDTRRSAFFKRFCDQNVGLCAHYGQTRMDPPLNEVTAWRLAYAMGDPWRQLLPTAVLRQLRGHGGALVNDKHGRVNGEVFREAEGQVNAAGFWDALVGQQDRNGRNYRYVQSTKRLGLIDHGFAFARPGDICNAAMFHATRKRLAGTITSSEQKVLEALLASDDLYGLRGFLDEDRVEALENRAREMLRSRLIPVPGAF